MSDAASAALTEFAAPPAAASAPPAGTPPEGTPPAAGSPPAGSPPPASAGTAANDKWWATFGDETTRAFAETKNWKTPEDVVKSYHNLEKIVGDKSAALIMPGADAKPEEWGAFYDKLGRPGSPDNYKLPDAMKDDPAMKAFAPIAHQMGMTTKQWDDMSKFVASYQETDEATFQAERTARAQADVEELKAENPGEKYDSLREQFRRGKQDLGIDEQTEARLEIALGTKGFITLMAKVGAMNAETPFIDGGTRQSGEMSPEAARLERSRLEKDQNWMAAWMKGDAEKVAHMTKLHRIASGLKQE